MTSLPTRRTLAALLPAALVLAGLGACGSSEKPAGADAGKGDGVTGCDHITTPDWQLFTDPRLTVDPSDKVVSLKKKGDVVKFTDTAPVGWTTYAYSVGYLFEDGSIGQDRSAIFVGAEHTQKFELAGPFAPMTSGKGPHTGVLQIEATDDRGSTPIARICVRLAESE